MASTQRSNIEVFFRVLGADATRRAFRDLGNAGIDTSRKLAGLGAGIGGAFASAGRAALELSKTIGAIGSVGLGALAKGIKETTDSSAELTSIVLALRAINGEVGKASKLPLFKADKNGFLQDTSSDPRVQRVRQGKFVVSGLGGGAAQTADDLAFVQKVADDAGRSIKDLARQYVQLNASATKVGVPLGDVRDLFTGISSASTVLGISADATNRAFVALNQIASKGVVSAEELRGQLAEALPGAIPLAAQAYGQSVQQFLEAVGNGQVDSAEFIARFGKALNDEYARSATAASKTTGIALGRLANSFFLAKVAIGNGVLDQEFARIVNAASKLLKLLNTNGAFTRFGANLAAAIRPLADRFEVAVNGGYDFERVLNLIARVAAGLVEGFLAVVTVVNKVTTGIGNLMRVFDGYGLQVPKTTGILIGLADAFLRITKAIQTRTFTGNGFLDFFVSLYAVIEACMYALGRMIGPKVGPGVRTLEQTFAAMAKWLNQAAAAITTLASGQVSPVLDETGEGILVFLTQAVDKVRQLIASIRLAWALLSGKDAPEGADLDTQKMFAKRDALAGLFTGEENAARFNDQGQQLYDPAQFETLFQIRDLITGIVGFLYENRGAIGALFDGALDAIKLVHETIVALGVVLDPIAEALGFESLNLAVGYAIGFLFVFQRIAAVIGLVRQGILALIGGFQAFAALIGLTAPQLLVIGAILAGVVFIVAKVAANWRLLKDEIGNIITLIGAGLTAGIAKAIRGLAGLLSYIPAVGGKIQRSLNGFADKLDEGVNAARENVYYTSIERTSQRQVENGGRDPFADGAKGAFDFLGDGGFAKVFGDFAAKQDEANAQLAEIAKQGAASNDNGRLDADLRRAAAAGADRAGVDPSFSKPVVIYLSTGERVELRGREADAAKFESLAASTAKTRATQSPAWGS